MTLVRRATAEKGPEGQLVAITPTEAGWQYVHFSAHHLEAGKALRGDTGQNETALVVLGGLCTVQAGGQTFASIGKRRDVWAGIPPYLVLLPPGSRYAVRAESRLHLVVAGAPAQALGPPRLIRPDEIAVEERGEGQTRRTIHHLLPPAAPAERLILFEAYTPAGNWSSFPPHKHDTDNPPRESYLEELYYYQLKPTTGFALQRVYTTDRSLDETVAAGDGDLVLVPRGYHVVATTPGHDCYYLNVMAGPSRAWNFQVDPEYFHLMNWQAPACTGDGS